MILNNRELAVGAWIVIVLLWVLSKAETKASLQAFLRVLVSRQVLLGFLLIVAYVWGETLFLSKIGLWNGSHVSKTLIWIFTVAIVSFVNIGQATNQVQFIKDAALRNFKMSVILSFLVNFYTFPFVVEFVLVPFLVVIAGLQVVADAKVEYRPVKKLVDNFLAIFGLSLLAYAIYAVWADFGHFAQLDTLKKFAVPIELSLLFIPLIYFFAVLLLYESLFIRLKIFVKDKAIYDFMKWRVLSKCNLSLARLRTWSERLPGIEFSSTKEALASFDFQRLDERASPPDGFRGRAWGSAPGPEMTKLSGPTDDDLTTYTLAESFSSPPLFGVAVAGECFQFERGKLYGVSVFLDGSDAFDKVRYEFQRFYGPATFANIPAGLYKWKWEDRGIQIQLYFEANHQRATVDATLLLKASEL